MWRNTENGFGLVAIALHWLMALAIFFLFGLGLYMVELSYYDSWYRGSLDLHKSIGITLFGFWVLRLLWKCVNPSPRPLSDKSIEIKAAKLGHIALYMLLILLMISGYLISTADGRGIEVFELFEVPGFGELVENQEDIAGDIHEILAWSLIGMVVLHAMAAIKHHYIEKDATLVRMLSYKLSSKASQGEQNS